MNDLILDRIFILDLNNIFVKRFRSDPQKIR